MRLFFQRVIRNKVVQNSGWLIGERVAQLVISFFVGIITVRYLGPSNYGTLNLAMTYTAFIMPFCNLGIANVIVKELVDKPDKEGELLGSSIAARLCTALAMIFILAAIMFLIHPSDSLMRHLSFVYSFVLIFKSLDIFGSWYQARMRSKISAIIATAAYLVTSLYRIFLLIFKADVFYFAVAFVLDAAMVAVMYLIAYKKEKGSTLRVSLKTAKYLLSQSYHFILSAMLVTIYAQTDKIMIGKMMDETSVGLYATAVNVCNLWVFVLQAFVDSARPSIVRAHQSDKKLYNERIIQLYSLIIWLSITVSVIFSLFAPIIINILYGNEFADSADPLRIITWYTCFSYLGVARNIWSVCEGKQKYEKYYAAAGAAANIILNFLLIPVWGINGAAAASLLTQIVTNVLVPYCIRETRENAVFVLKAFDFRHLFKALKEI
ncbi:MAG: flippase [Ruminococcus sp.]|nr:flippase [Ruminococcus sp.]